MEKFGIRSDVKLGDFTDLWANDPDCSLAKWCRSQGEKTIRDAFPAFRKMIQKSPEHARWIFFHLGWLVDDEFRMELVTACANSGVQSFHLFMEDETLSMDEDAVLMQSFIVDNPCTEYMASAGLASRKKTERAAYNAESEIVVAARHRGII